MSSRDAVAGQTFSKEQIMGKGNNSHRKETKKPKKDKKK